MFTCFVLDKKSSEEEKISTGASYKTTQRKLLKSGTGSLYQVMPFQFNFITYRASRSISSNGIIFLLFYHKNKNIYICALRIMETFTGNRNSIRIIISLGEW
jgi:hypothetical protein